MDARDHSFVMEQRGDLPVEPWSDLEHSRGD
jgi:hypothetical protein